MASTRSCRVGDVRGACEDTGVSDRLERPACTLGKASVRTLSQRTGEMRPQSGPTAVIGGFARRCAVAPLAARCATGARCSGASVAGNATDCTGPVHGGFVEGSAARSGSAPARAARAASPPGGRKREGPSPGWAETAPAGSGRRRRLGPGPPGRALPPTPAMCLQEEREIGGHCRGWRGAAAKRLTTLAVSQRSSTTFEPA